MPSPSLPFFQELLSPGGFFYMVAVEDNNPTEIVSVMRGYGVHAEVRKPKGAPHYCTSIL
ncbi:unnamed protein product, partial [Ectocarpus sp. 8 AP-2014]